MIGRLQNDVYLLTTEIILERKTQLAPRAGQFYLIKAKKSSVQLDRPISVYHSEEKVNADGKRCVTVEYMILQKGTGTKELCSLEKGALVETIGPLGNTFAGDASLCKEDKVCIMAAELVLLLLQTLRLLWNRSRMIFMRALRVELMLWKMLRQRIFLLRLMTEVQVLRVCFLAQLMLKK